MKYNSNVFLKLRGNETLIGLISFLLEVEIFTQKSAYKWSKHDNIIL